jgi:hypothetical protein
MVEVVLVRFASCNNMCLRPCIRMGGGKVAVTCGVWCRTLCDLDHCLVLAKNMCVVTMMPLHDLQAFCTSGMRALSPRWACLI